MKNRGKISVVRRSLFPSSVSGANVADFFIRMYSDVMCACARVHVHVHKTFPCIINKCMNFSHVNKVLAACEIPAYIGLLLHFKDSDEVHNPGECSTSPCMMYCRVSC